MKKILLFGPIGDFGGRDIEVNLIARALSSSYQVKIFSTIYITEQSQALENLKNVAFSSMQIRAFNAHWRLKFWACIFYLKHKMSAAPYAFVSNQYSKKRFDFKKQNIEFLKEEICQADLVIACVQLTSNYLVDLVDFCLDKKKPIVIRTTGTIFPFEGTYFNFIKKVPLFVHHSQANADNLNQQIKAPYTIIDQCAQNEAELLNISNAPKKSFVFGYLGRFSQEKGILPLLDFFIKRNDLSLVIAGDGIQKPEVTGVIERSKNISYLGSIASEEVAFFFKQIDVLIIPSFEESGPLVGLEAMAAGKIIVSTRVGAMPERLEKTDNQFWFDIQDIKSLEEVVDKLTLLDDEQKMAIGMQNRKKYLEFYQKDIIEKKYNDLVFQMLDFS